MACLYCDSTGTICDLLEQTDDPALCMELAADTVERIDPTRIPEHQRESLQDLRAWQDPQAQDRAFTEACLERRRAGIEPSTKIAWAIRWAAWAMSQACSATDDLETEKNWQKRRLRAVICTCATETVPSGRLRLSLLAS
jgi:hypothetical protein